MRLPYLIWKSIILQATLIGAIPVFTVFSILVLMGFIFPGFHHISILVTISMVLGFVIETIVTISGLHWSKKIFRSLRRLIQRMKNYLNRKETIYEPEP